MPKINQEEYEEELNLKEQMSVAMDRLEEVCGIAMKEVRRVFGGSGLESEETEVKKDKKWANEEIKKERNLLNDKRYEREVDDLTTGVLLGLKKALNILNQLDEPEANNSFYWFTANRRPIVSDVSYSNREKLLYGFKQTPNYKFIEYNDLRFITHATLDELIEQYK